MGEQEQKQMSLREAIAQGFAREDAQEAAQGAQESMMPEEAGQAAEQENASGAPTAAPTAGTEGIPEITQAAAAQNQAAQAANPAPQQGQEAGQLMQYLLAQLQQAQAQNQQLAAQLQQAQGTVQQQSQAAEAAIDRTMAQPSVTVPVLDFSEMQYDDDATREQKMRDWQDAMVRNITDSVAAQYASQLAPIREEYEEKRRAADMAAAKSQVYGDQRFSDFKDRDAQIENILSQTPELANMPADRRYLLAGLVARGLNYQAQPSAEDIVKYYKSSPDAQRMIDAERARTIADRNGQIPTIMPSSGLSTANAVPDESPKTMEDLRRRIADRWR